MDMNIQPELIAFATRLDDSKLLRTTGLDVEETTVAAYELIQGYQLYAGEHVEETAQALDELENTPPEAMGEHHAHEVFHAKEMLKYWELEHQTWELFGALISHRLSSEGRSYADIPPELANDRYAADARIRNYFFNTDASYRELTIVLEWLRRYAPGPTADDIEADALYRGDRGWMYTKEKIKSNKRLRLGKQLSLLDGGLSNGFMLSVTTARDGVTELDPDAPSRQQRQLEEEDEAWERYLMKLVWGFLRKGELQNAQDLCEDAGEFWRAASLSGGQDAWDSKIDGPQENEEGAEDPCVKGNRRRELWKRMCYAIARRRGGDEFEQAVYGTLCGDIESVGVSLICPVQQLLTILGITCLRNVGGPSFCSC
jgi:nuclear pore complex protein Nup107